MLQTLEPTATAQPKAVLDGFLEQAAEVIAAQPKLGRTLIEAKALLARKSKNSASSREITSPSGRKRCKLNRSPPQ